MRGISLTRLKTTLALVIVGIILPATASALSSPQFSPKIRHFTEADGLPQGIVTCVTQDSRGYVWVGSWNGLSRYDGYTFTNFKARPGDNCPLATGRIFFVREAQGGNILCKCEGGYYLFNTAERKFAALNGKKSDSGDRFRPTPQQTELVENLPEYKGRETHILYKDRQGGYWIFTHRGLDRLTFERDRISPVKTCSVGEEFVRTIFRDAKNRLFIADKNGFLRLYAPSGSLLGYVTPDGGITKARTPFGANVYSVFQDTRGCLWAGTKPKGLFRLEEAKNGGFTVKHFVKTDNPHSISGNSIYAIKQDRFGRILVATYGGGLNIIEDPWGDNPRFVNPSNGMPQYPDDAMYIHDILLARDGTLLIATRNGLFVSPLRKDARKMAFTRYKRHSSDPNSLSDDQCMALLQSRGGAVYVATYAGGLNIIKNGTDLAKNIGFTAFSTENGMASDVVLNMCEDKDGMLWIVSEHCIMKYDPAKETFTNCSGRLFSGGFTFSEVRPLYNAADGTMLFGTTQGVLSLHTADMAKSRFRPNIVFDAPPTIELSPEERSVTVRFAAIDLNKNEPIQYAYMMEGVDSQWMYTTENRINLTNIPAGEHRLRVKSTNGDGVWVDNEQSVTISRTPYFNERPVAWMIYGASLLLAVLLAVKLYRYVRGLEREISELKLSRDEKKEYLRMKLGDIMSGANAPGDAKNGGFIGETGFSDRVAKIVAEHIADAGYDVNTLAGEMCMSRSSLYVAMKRELGCTPNNYVLGQRLKAAYAMLTADKRLGVSEIAYRCGFSDPKYFSRCFKKTFDVTPSELRSDA